jgi:hypothetical protein
VVFQDAAVHHHVETRSAGAFRGLFVDYAFLHPHHFGLLADGGLHYRWYEFRAAEDHDYIERLGDRVE